MKRLFVVVALACAFAVSSYAQDYKEVMKEHREMSKMAEKEIWFKGIIDTNCKFVEKLKIDIKED